MGRTKETAEKMREATREKIISAAVDLFAQKGLAGTSAKDIAKRAGVSVGLMYHYYKSKEEVFAAIEQQAVAEIAQLQEMLENEKSPENAIKLLADEIFKEMGESLEFARWTALLPCTKELISALSKHIGEQKAQFFVAVIQGLCQLQLTLKEDFCIPSIELITSFLKEEKN